MFKLDNNFLVSLGLGGLPVDEKNRLLQVIYERLEMNVGMRLAEKMTDQQLDEFEGFIDRNDEAGALRWLETNFPNYKDVVAEELEKLKQEVAASAPQILAAAQSLSQQPPQAQPPLQPAAPVAPSVPPAGVPGQQPPQSQAYNPENPFQTNNPEFGGAAPGQAPAQPAWQPAPAPMQPASPAQQPPMPAAPQYQPQPNPLPPQAPQAPFQPAPGFGSSQQPSAPYSNNSGVQPTPAPSQQPPPGPGPQNNY